MSFNISGDISVVSSKFKWIVNNFCTTCRNVGDSLHSPPFLEKNNIPCTLKVYPKGEDEASKDHFLLLLSVHAKIEGTVVLQILNNKGEAVVSHTADVRPFINGTYLYEYKKYGLRDFIVHPANNILENDKMTITCKIAQLTTEEMKKHGDKKTIRQEERQSIQGRLVEID